MKISQGAMRHAQKIAAARAAKKMKGRPRGKLRGEELGDGISDIPIIGPLLGGLFGGGGGGAKAATPGTTESAGSASMNPAPDLQSIRTVVQDALGLFAGLNARDANQRAQAQTQARTAVDSIFGALDPTLRQARGGTQVQRLQAQATSEHNTLQRQADRDRVSTERYTTLNQKLDTLITRARAMQTALAAPSPMARAILNIH